MDNFVTVAQVGEIPEGEGRAFEVGESVVAVFNDGGTFRAIDDMCPHMGASLATGHLEDGVVACPWHAWRFDTRDGAWCDNRRLKVDVYQIRVVGQDVQVAVPAQSDGANQVDGANDRTEGEGPQARSAEKKDNDE